MAAKANSGTGAAKPPKEAGATTGNGGDSAKTGNPQEKGDSKDVKTDDIPKGMIRAKGGVYYAKRKCYFGITLYDGGPDCKKPTPLVTKEGQLIPHHFIPAKELLAEIKAREEAELAAKQAAGEL